MEAENETGSGACWACGAGLDAGDNYCGKCGRGQGRYLHWYYKHWGAVVLTLALGPFSLFFVWRSPILSRTAKWAYTAVIAPLTWYAARTFYGFWRLYLDMLNGMPLPH